MWGLGCILYELAFRKKAFSGDEAVLKYKLSKEKLTIPPRIESSNNSLVNNVRNLQIETRSGAFLNTILQAMLNLQHSKRPTARALCDLFTSAKSWGSEFPSPEEVDAMLTAPAKRGTYFVFLIVSNATAGKRRKFDNSIALSPVSDHLTSQMELHETLPMNADPKRVESFIVNYTNTRIVTYSSPLFVGIPRGSIYSLWNPANRRLLWRFERKINMDSETNYYQKPVHPSFSPDGRYLAILDKENTFLVLDTVPETVSSSEIKRRSMDQSGHCIAIALYSSVLFAFARCVSKVSSRVTHNSRQEWGNVTDVWLPDKRTVSAQLCYTNDGSAIILGWQDHLGKLFIGTYDTRSLKQIEPERCIDAGYLSLHRSHTVNDFLILGSQQFNKQVPSVRLVIVVYVPRYPLMYISFDGPSWGRPFNRDHRIGNNPHVFKDGKLFHCEPIYDNNYNIRRVRVWVNDAMTSRQAHGDIEVEVSAWLHDAIGVAISGDQLVWMVENGDWSSLKIGPVVTESPDET